MSQPCPSTHKPLVNDNSFKIFLISSFGKVFCLQFTCLHLSPVISFQSLSLLLSCSLSLVCFLPSIYLPFTLPIRFLHWPCLLGAAWVPPSSLHCVSISLGWLSSFQHGLSLYLQNSDFSNSFQKVPYDNCSVYFRRCEVLKLN